ncbi:MAG: hypothetical protein J5674_06215, partial [Candidatus Methanomethylophilaceae archaeon]|nr:hypothetical protein [Candidatus Methanomethylophilaceae archaeon]
LPPGISAVVLGREAYENRILRNDSHLYYLDLKRHIEDQARGQTPFTPAVGTLMEMNVALRAIDRAGIEKSVERAARLARYFRKKAAERGIGIPGYPLSNAVTPVLLDSGAYDVFLRLKDGYGIVVTPSGGDLRDRMLRVGHIGNLSEEDYDALFEALDEVLGLKGR